jgi:hypothetical protein
MSKIEYRVRPVTRYIVTRHEESDGGKTGGSSQHGEYDNSNVAYEVGYALARAEQERLGYPPGDERITYPMHPDGVCVTGHIKPVPMASFNSQ